MRKLLATIGFCAALASCSTEVKQDPFEWNADRVGYITKDTKIYQIDSLFTNDSIVAPTKGDEFASGPNKILIYEKGGKHLLTLTPTEANDSTAVIENIQIHDDRYKTKSGVTISSPFSEIAKNYKISGIDNALSSAVIWVDSENFYFTIDKKLLPADVKYDLSAPIEASQIPDGATATYFFMSW